MLAEKAAQRLQETTSSEPTNPPSLLDFVPQVSPHLDRPDHLEPLADALERAALEPLRLLISTPPQHGKSELTFHWLAHLLLYRPRDLLYITYSGDFSQSQMTRARPIAEHAGVPFNDSGAKCEWRTSNGGSLWATGIGGSVTGRPGGIVLIDDPIKDWEAAQSQLIRDRTDAWLRTAVLTRVHPDSSVVIVQTRWHEDDISGRLEAEGWERINLPAIGENEKALWPERRPLWWLEKQRAQIGEHKFAALYQGRPQPVGGELFQQPVTCAKSDIPNRGRFVIGVDLAYSAKTQSDYSVAVVLRQIPRTKEVYVQDVVRKQCRAPEFLEELHRLRKRYQNAPMYWYASGSERGSADFIKESGVRLHVENATNDKFVRAQPVSAAWNMGEVTVPYDAPWSDAFIDEVRAFTGMGDAHDDQVDALAAAWDFMPSAEGPRVEHRSVQRRVTANWRPV